MKGFLIGGDKMFDVVGQLKCPECGAENPDWKRICVGCGKPLPQPAGDRQNQGSQYGVGPDSRAVSTKMRLDYLHGIGDPVLRKIDGIQSLLSQFRKPVLDIEALLQDAANQISKNLAIDNVAIGLRDPKDGLYHYRAMVGFREDAVEAHKKIVYRKEQFFDNPEYQGTDLSKQSRLYLAEDNDLTREKGAFNRPGLLSSRRSTVSQSLEGDYIDVKILGPYDDLLGWIEISGTRTMQLPDTATVRWVEMIASIVALAVMYKSARE